MRLPLFILGGAVAAVPVGSQLSWLIANHGTQLWRLPVILVIGAVLAACAVWCARRWHAGRPERTATLSMWCVATYPLLLGWAMPLVRLLYPHGPHANIVAGIGAGIAVWTLTLVALRAHPRVLKLALSVPFIAVLYVVLNLHLMGVITGWGHGSNAQEARTPAPMPTQPNTLAELQAWPAAYESHLNDTFHGRLALINTSSAIDLLVLNRNSDPNGVIMGKDRWLFRGNRERRNDYAGHWVMEPALRLNLSASLAQRQAALQQAGIPYLLVLAPDKASVYPELIPVADRPEQARRKLDQIIELLDSLHLSRLDLRASLATSPLKAHGPLYYLSDIHWNQRGAYAASEAIATFLRPQFAVGELPFDALITTPRRIPGGDLARFLGDPELFAEDAPQLVPTVGWRHRAVPISYTGMGHGPVVEWPQGIDFIAATEHPNAALPTAVIFHDSFGLALRPFLAERFRRCVFAWSHVVSQEIVAAECPDIVIQVRSEEFAELLAKPDVPRFDQDPR